MRLKTIKALIFTLFIGLLLSSLTGCAKTATAASTETETVISATSNPPTSTATLPPGVVPTPTLSPDAWQEMPIIPTVSDTAKRIYAEGQALGNDPHAFSIVGDCLSLATQNSPNLFVSYNKPGHYNLGDYTSLQPVIDWFFESFGRQSLSLNDGFNAAAVLSTFRADPKQCQAGETPLECEYRIFHPSYSIISLGTDDYKTPSDVFESRMRQIVETTISKGIVPILVTKADNREGNNSVNQTIARLAYEYDVPLWNFWLAVKPLPYGVVGDEGHLYWADPDHFEYANAMEVAIPVRNLTALQTLMAVWQGVTNP